MIGPRTTVPARPRLVCKLGALRQNPDFGFGFFFLTWLQRLGRPLMALNRPQCPFDWVNVCRIVICEYCMNLQVQAYRNKEPINGNWSQVFGRALVVLSGLTAKSKSKSMLMIISSADRHQRPSGPLCRFQKGFSIHQPLVYAIAVYRVAQKRTPFLCALTFLNIN